MTPAYLLPPLLDEYAAFLRTIAAAQERDTPRLVLADWLEEHDAPERVTCERCGSLGWIVYGSGLTPALKKVSCPDCEGEGSRLVSNGCGERAEFIRVQCELARRADEVCGSHPRVPGGQHTNGPCRCPRDLRILRGRSAELHADNREKWWPADGPELDWRRGFVDTVRGPLGVLLGEPCGWCEGIGYRLLYAEDYPQCSRCRGTGRTPGTLERMGAELLAVRGADVSDREPWVNLDRTHWGWWERNSFHNEDDSLLDRELMLAMAADPTRGDWDIGVRFTEDSPPGGCVLFRTEAAARDALSRAVLAVARRRAGLEREPIDPVPAS